MLLINVEIFLVLRTIEKKNDLDSSAFFARFYVTLITFIYHGQSFFCDTDSTAVEFYEITARILRCYYDEHGFVRIYLCSPLYNDS